MEHPNSKKISIFRLPGFLAGVQSAEIQKEFFDQAKQSIGSYYASLNSQEIGSGLTNGEKNLLLPYIIDIPADDREFRKKVTEFYCDIDTKIPPGDYGCELEIGLETDNNQPVSQKNLPIDIMGYIRWKHALGHPFVARNKEAAIGNPLIRFYIFDKTEVFKKNASKNQLKDKAYSDFLKIKEDRAIVDQMLTLLGTNIREYIGLKNSDEAKVEKLRDYAINGDHKLFSETYNQEHFEAKHWVKRMVMAEVIFQQHGKYYDAESKQLLANNLDEMIAYYLDKENSAQLVMYKSRAQEAESRPLIPAIHKTVV